jgi:hypothetical protein
MAVKTPKAEEVYVATTSFSAEGYPEPVRAGVTLVLASHELRRRYPDYFKPARESVVEQATAAPGERR